MFAAKRCAITAIFAFVPIAVNASSLTTLYTFEGASSGGFPFGPLIYQDGQLFGTIPGDGATNLGNVFSVNATSGAYTLVHAFQGGLDGSAPEHGVIYQDGILYGTTALGGGEGCVYMGQAEGCGTIFSINPQTKVEAVLYDFPQNKVSNFTFPTTLSYLGGVLFATTTSGGAYGHGSLFSFNPTSSSFSTLYSFTGGADGDQPNPQMLYNNGLFYGTTVAGGLGCVHSFPSGCGTIFTLNPNTGAATLLHEFKSGEGGKYPYSNLIYYMGRLIGDTNSGGDREACRHGCGVTFSVNALKGTENVLDTFAAGGEGYSGLTLVHGFAYETLPAGGAGNGALVKLDLSSGQQTVLYTFTGGADGKYPMVPLTYHGGAFYGSTTSGGGGGCYEDKGCGTVFKFVP